MIKQMLKYIAAIIVVFAAYYPFSQTLPESPTTVSVVPSDKQDTPVIAKKKIKRSVKNVHLPDFASIRDVKEKKRAFFSFMKPFVLEVNEEILEQRAFVKSFEIKTGDPKPLIKLAKKYRIKELDNLSLVHQTLMRRVDIIPVDLVLMQAANESGWGTSRFALEANNLFGQWCFRKGCGVIPSGRPKGETYEVRKFNTPADSIRSYFHNLNTGYAYEDLRKIRSKQRLETNTLNAHQIAQGLLPYSTRREAYVEEIQTMLRINKKYI